jgi:glyoxylase-like metal-dependent hydrolase (beta-lactamase superfamily II)
MKQVKLSLNYAGFCLAKAGHAVKGDRNKDIKFHALFGIIAHPEHGWILFDTGYAQRFMEATSTYPNKIYAQITKVHLKDTDEVRNQLGNYGIKCEDIRHIIISHFHADHVGGLIDFPNAIIHCSRKAFEYTQSLSSYFAFTKGVIKDLIPNDIIHRVKFIEDTQELSCDGIFTIRYNIFNDNSIIAYDLPGHAVGQIGILCETSKSKYFLIADACWDYRAYTSRALPNQIVRLFFDSWKDYKDSIDKIAQFHKAYPDVKIIPTHCSKTTDLYVKKNSTFDEL